jgi:Ca2+-binding EF-hand superfamily protein
MARYSALIALTGFIAASTVHAQAAPTFESLDKNGDGKISLNEASDNDDLFVKFKTLDKDKDGTLSKEEFGGYKK